MTDSADQGPYVRADVRQFLAYLNSLPGPARHEMEPAAARAAMATTMELVDLPIGSLAIIRELSIPGLAGTIPARLFDARERREPGPAMMFYHGGGFVMGDLDTHASFCAEAARVLDIPVVSVDYRLAPEARWPAAADDAETAARWVAGSPAELDRRVTSLVVCGDSAGGNLAIVVAMDLRDRAAAVPVIVHAPIYPVVALGADTPSYTQFADGYLLSRATMEWFADCYAADLQHQRASPLVADLAGMPAAVVITASLDPIRDQGRAYAAALAEAGVPVVFRRRRATSTAS